MSTSNPKKRVPKRGVLTLSDTLSSTLAVAGLNRIRDLMHDTRTSPSVRRRAAEVILLRAYGPPHSTHVEVPPRLTPEQEAEREASLQSIYANFTFFSDQLRDLNEREARARARARELGLELPPPSEVQ